MDLNTQSVKYPFNINLFRYKKLITNSIRLSCRAHVDQLEQFEVFEVESIRKFTILRPYLNFKTEFEFRQI